MSKMTQMTLTGFGSDGKGIMVLDPRGVNPSNGVAMLSEKATSPILERRVTISVSQPTRNRQSYKVQLKLSNPVECTSTTSCDSTVARTSYADISFTFSKTSHVDERTWIRRELLALLSQEAIIDAIDNLNPAY